ncbi:MAG: glycosyltransferase family 2 protein [Pirellulales bacterium]|nr:glycosyltransferase family 2 protein [Pirellulales bacterium]
MSSFVLLSWSTVAFAGLIQALLGLLQTWEHRRFAVSRIRTPATAPEAPSRVLLCVPCKGQETGLAENLRPLFQQDHGNYELALIVESLDDPAVATIRQMLAEFPSFDARLVVAGRAADGGQKVHNLLAATAHLSPAISTIAFADSDARPQRSWLTRLVARLERLECGATTGYRWFVPQRAGLGNALLYSINAGVASMLGPGGHHLVWGGSWAIARATFDRLDLHDAWYGAVSDDLVASRVLARAGLKIEFVPECMVASPLDVSLGQSLEFIRRQYMMARFNVPKYFWLAGMILAIAVGAFWGGLVLALFGALSGAAWWTMPLAATLSIYLLLVARGIVRQAILQACLPQAWPTLRAWAVFDCLAAPLATLVHWAGWMSALNGRCVTWRGVTYRFLRGGQVAVLGRATSAAESFTPPRPHSRSVRTGDVAQV